MKKLILIPLIFLGVLRAEGPLFHHNQTEKQQEFENVYKDLRSKIPSSRITGVTNGSDAPVGSPGEYISSTTNQAYGSFPTSAQYSDLVVINLTPGDWDISFVACSRANGATVTMVQFGIGTVTGNSATGLIEGDNTVDILPPIATADNCTSVSGWRASISENTTYRLKQEATYSVAVPKSAGRISARRIR